MVGARAFARLTLIALAVLAAAMMLARDGRPASAAGTEILLVQEPFVVAVHSGSIVMYTDGPPKQVFVWVENVKDPSGAAAFEAEVVYDPAMVSVTDIEPDIAWLESSGRTVLQCADPPVIEPIPSDPEGRWRANVSCVTADPEPDGPTCPDHCSGLVATVTLQPGSQRGATPLDHNTFLISVEEAGEPFPDPMAATPLASTLQIYPCADFNGDNAVFGGDIGLIVSHFGDTPASPSWDPMFDVNGDGGVFGTDIGITVMQFGEADCDTPP